MTNSRIQGNHLQAAAFRTIICGKCGAREVKLYRPMLAEELPGNGDQLRHLRCIRCIPEGSTVVQLGNDAKPGNYIPAIPGNTMRLLPMEKITEEGADIWKELPNQ